MEKKNITNDTIYTSVLSPPLGLLPTAPDGRLAADAPLLAVGFLPAEDGREERAAPARAAGLFLTVVLRELSLCVIDLHVVFQFSFETAGILIP